MANDHIFQTTRRAQILEITLKYTTENACRFQAAFFWEVENVAGSREYGDEPSGSGATELVLA
jgi:hypothetical protein